MLLSCGASQVDLSPRAKLDAPQGLSAQASDLDIALSWNPVAGATHYIVYWDRNPTVSPATGTAATSTETHYLHSGLVNGATYAYLVVAVDGDGYEGRPSLVVTATPSLARLEAPQRVTAVAGDAMVTLTWDAVTGATEYRVYVTARSPDGSTWNTQGVTTHNSFVDQPLQNYATYRYQIEARFGSRIGTLSAPVSAVPLPRIPGIPTFTHVEAGLVIDPTGQHGKMTLKWAATADATSYVVYAKRESDPLETPLPLTGTPPPATMTFMHLPIDLDVNYTYRVEAFKEGASDGRSEAVTALVPSPHATNLQDHYLIRGEDDGIRWTTAGTASAVPATSHIQITWTPQTPTIPGIRQNLYRAITSTGPYRLITTFFDPQTNSYIDTGFPAQSFPTGLTAVAAGSGVDIDWNPLEGAVYRLYWWEKDEAEAVRAVGMKTVASTHYTHSPVVSGRKYTYAVQVEGQESVSPDVSVTAP